MINKLVERDHEEKTLARVFSECCLGTSQTVALGGPLASGKTALLDSFARDAADAGATVLTAAATNFECYQPLRLIDRLLRGSRSISQRTKFDLLALAESADEAETHDEISASVLGLLQGAIQHFIDAPPLVVCINDAHFMDVESLRYLLALVQQMADTPVSVVLTYCPETGEEHVQRIIQDEILGMPNCTRLDLDPLSEKGVATVLEDYFNLEVVGRIAAECKRLSGGRPLLVHALAEDYASPTSESAVQGPLIAGPAFGGAVLSCLYRAEPMALEIAQAMATLDEFGSTAIVASLCGIDPESAVRVAASPGVGGLLEQEILGQPSVRAAVLRSIPKKERHAMRSHAARLSYRQAAPAFVIAGRQAMRVVARPGTRSPAKIGVADVPYAEQLRLWLPLTYPGIDPDRASETVAEMDSGLGTPEYRAATALGALLEGAGEQVAVPAAELVLREALAGAATPVSSLAALIVLIYADSLERASVWCDALLSFRAETYTLVWNAMFASARAEILYRRGALADARWQAHAALALMPRENWGAAIVAPLSLLILTATAMGDLAEAERHLDVPVPSAAFGTLGGVAYLNARGHFHLSRGHHDTALQDFLTAGHLMKLWKADCPSAVPWRTHAARAYLHKGLLPQAREMITEHMSLIPAGQSRTRGLAYHALAATLPLDQRPAMLLKAANILDRCGDSLNLAYTLADLGHAYASLGKLAQARSYSHQAEMLAGRCAAALLPEVPVTIDERAVEESHTEAPPPPIRQLSAAECRVAELAARGSTNEQIARKLYITVSTVEQHLTRIYRKLGIRSRTQLPSCL